MRQYDHEVQANSVVKPLVGVQGDAPSDAAVLQPLPGSPMGIALACGASSRSGALDPYAMALAVIDEALRNGLAQTPDPARVAILDNFPNWQKPDRPARPRRAAEGCQPTGQGLPARPSRPAKQPEQRVPRQRGDALDPAHAAVALGIVLTPALRHVDAKRREPDYLVGDAPRARRLALTRSLAGAAEFAARRSSRAPRILAALHAEIRTAATRAATTQRGRPRRGGGRDGPRRRVGPRSTSRRCQCRASLRLGRGRLPALLRVPHRFLVEVAPAHATDFERRFRSPARGRRRRHREPARAVRGTTVARSRPAGEPGARSGLPGTKRATKSFAGAPLVLRSAGTNCDGEIVRAPGSPARRSRSSISTSSRATRRPPSSSSSS